MPVDLICLRQEANEPLHEQKGLLSVTRVPIRHRRSGKLRYFLQYGVFLLQALFTLAWRSRRTRYDLIHVHNMPDVLVFSAIVPKLFGAKVILDLHDPMPELYRTIYGFSESSIMVRLLKCMECWSLGFADLILTPNESFRALFASRSCPAGKIHIVMNTPDEKLFSNIEMLDQMSQRHNGEFHIMYHGTIAERHGLHLAVEAIGHLVKSIPGIRLDIYGSRNNYLCRVESLIQRLGLEKHVKYRGKKMIDDIPSVIRQCNLGIIPNLTTPFTEINFPTRIFEYLSMGKPVIVPRTQGILDYFDDNSIIFFNPAQPGDLDANIQWVFDHPDEVTNTTRRGQQIYHQHTWQNQKQAFLGLVRDLLNP